MNSPHAKPAVYPLEDTLAEVGLFQIVLVYHDPWPTVHTALARHRETGQWLLCRHGEDEDTGKETWDDWKPVSVADALEWFARSWEYSRTSTGHIGALALDAAQLLKHGQGRGRR